MSRSALRKFSSAPREMFISPSRNTIVASRCLRRRRLMLDKSAIRSFERAHVMRFAPAVEGRDLAAGVCAERNSRRDSRWLQASADACGSRARLGPEGQWVKRRSWLVVDPPRFPPRWLLQRDDVSTSLHRGWVMVTPVSNIWCQCAAVMPRRSRASPGKLRRSRARERQRRRNAAAVLERYVR